VDTEPIRKLAESATLRAQDAHIAYQSTGDSSHLNDAFYWFGHANAYKGIIAMAEIATIVEDELDAEGSCP
jgi:hypothetical protein